MSETKRKGRVTIPTDVDVVPETLEILERWGADAIRDCDGTDYPEALKSVDAKVYSTYYTTRKDNAWAKANPDEVFRLTAKSKNTIITHIVQVPHILYCGAARYQYL